MKKILLTMLMSTGLFANFATVDCTEMSKVIELLQGYTKVCQIDTDVHSFEQEFSVDMAGTVEYEDGEIIPFATVNKVLAVNIEADRPFILRSGAFVSDRFKLSLLSDGSESWKYFYTDTSRWRSYSFPIITVEVIDDPIVDDPIVDDPIVDEPIVDEPIVIEPPVVIDPKPEGNVTSIMYDFSTFFTKDDEFAIQSRILHEDLTPFEGVRVQLITGDTTHEAVTDNLGVFTVLMTVGAPFTIRAFNTLSEPPSWSDYNGTLIVTKDGNVTDAPI